MTDDGSVPDGANEADSSGEPAESDASTTTQEEDEPGGEDQPAVETAGGEPTDREVVAAASEAAEGLVFSRYRRSDVRDVDVAVSFDEGVLEVDVYLNVPDADAEEHVDEEAQQVADDAALAAIDAVDRLFSERGG